MLLVGLTGGIASGKSTIAARLAEHGAIVLDADRIAREVVEPGEDALDAIVAAFGVGVLAEDGSLDRAALGAIVFADPAALATLNGITHPAIWRRTRAGIAAAEAADPDAVVVYDVPLLVEAGTARQLPFDLVVVADAPAEERRRRLVEVRGMAPAEADRRIAAQATDAQRRAIADVLIDTGGTLAETVAGADALWRELVARR